MIKEEEGSYFDLMDIWHIFTTHLLPILAAALICVGGLFAYAKYIRVPKYSSTAIVYILKQEREGNYAYTQSDFSLALNVVNDCVYMLKSSEVLDEVKEELGLDMTTTQISKCITTRNPDSTRILEVTVETNSAELSKRIVDAVCRIGADKISNTMSIDQVNIYSWGKINPEPSNKIGLTRYFIVGICAALFVFFLYFLSFLIDDKVRTEEDVEKYLNLTVLGVIPNAKDVDGKKYKKYGKYKSYGRYQPYYKYKSYGNQQSVEPSAKDKKSKEERRTADE